MEIKLKQLIESSERILVTSHLSPDGDSVSSCLLLHKIIKKNYPDKQVVVSMEESPFGLDFLSGYDEINFQPLHEALKSSPHLLIVLDANALHRITRHPESINLEPFKLAVIDHHEGMEFNGADIYINNKSPATTLDVYHIFIEKLGMNKPNNYAQVALTGIYTDTGGFVHRNFNVKKTFEVVPKLISDGADIELIASKLNSISEKGLEILTELLRNTKFSGNHTYSYISDQTAIQDNLEALIQATEAFRTNFLRNVENRPWGFIVYRDVLAEGSIYSASFRSLGETKDVSELAAALGGGGHKPAAGAKFEAKNVQEAVKKVQQMITGV